MNLKILFRASAAMFITLPAHAQSVEEAYGDIVKGAQSINQTPARGREGKHNWTAYWLNDKKSGQSLAVRNDFDDGRIGYNICWRPIDRGDMSCRSSSGKQFTVSSADAYGWFQKVLAANHGHSFESIVPPAGTSSSSTSFSVPFYSDYDNSAHINVTLGSSYPARMLVDTGATGITINTKVAMALLQNGDADPMEPEQVKLADGTSKQITRVRVHSLTINGHTVYNLSAGITPDAAEMLLGFSVLSQFGQFSIDTAKRRIVFGEEQNLPPQHEQPQQTKALAAPSRPRISYRLSGDQVIELSGLDDAVDSTCAPDQFSGTVVHRNFYPGGMEVSEILIEQRNGERLSVFVSSLGQDVSRVDRSWVNLGLQTLTREGRFVSGRGWRCGQGRILSLDAIR